LSARKLPTGGSKKKVRTRAKPSPTRKPAAKKPARKKPAAKKATRKAPAKKPAARKKTSPAKGPAKKAPARKQTSPARRKPAKKPVTKRTTAKKPTRKTAARKAPAKKTAARKAPARKAVAKKTTKKAVIKKAVKKTTSRKAPARAKTPARKPAGTRGKATAKAAAKKPSPKTRAKQPAAKTIVKKSAAPAARTQKGSPARRAGGTTKKATRPSASPDKTSAKKKARTIETPKTMPAARRSAAAGKSKKKTARTKARSRDGRQPGQAMRVPRPKVEVLVTAELPDIRRAAVADERREGHRGHLQPNAAAQAMRAEDWEEPVDASLMMTALAVDVSPKIEDNYDYSVLDEFAASEWCPRPTRMINTACGGGEAAVFFAQRGFRCVGIDSDRSQIGLARERAWLAGVDIDFMVGDLFETPKLLPAGSFGLAIDRGGFSHLEGDRERQRYLANTRRLLFEGGIFVLSAGFFPFADEKKSSRGRDKADARKKLLLAREGGVVVGELRQGGFELQHRVLRRTQDSGELAELILYMRKP